MQGKNLVMDAYDFQRMGDAEFSEGAFRKVAEASGELRDFLYHSGDAGDQHRMLDTEFAIVLVLPNGDRMRKYPINSKTDLQMSIAAFNKVYKRLPYNMVNIIVKRFESAALRYGVDISSEPWYNAIANAKGEHLSFFYPVTEGLLATLDSIMEKQASAEETGHFGINQDINGATYQRYPINTKAQLQHAIAVVEKNARHWLASYAIQMSRAIEKRAEELNVTIPEDSSVHKYAARSFSDSAYGHIMARTTMVNNMDGYMAYRDLAEKVASKQYSPAQAAVTLDNLDHANKLHYSRHDRGLARPVDAVLGWPIKTAKTVSIGGIDIDVSKLHDMAVNDPSLLVERLGSDVVGKLRSDPEGTLMRMAAPQRTVVLDVMGRKA